MNTNRPTTALNLRDVAPGTRLVVYSPGGNDRQEIEIIGFDEIVERSEVASLVRYKLLADPSGEVHVNEPASLGLTPSSDGEWYKYAIPFDE